MKLARHGQKAIRFQPSHQEHRQTTQTNEVNEQCVYFRLKVGLVWNMRAVEEEAVRATIEICGRVESGRGAIG